MIYAAVFMPVSYYFDYYIFTIQFETRISDVFYFVLSKDCFVLHKPGTFQIITFKSVALNVSGRIMSVYKVSVSINCKYIHKNLKQLYFQ